SGGLRWTARRCRRLCEAGEPAFHLSLLLGVWCFEVFAQLELCCVGSALANEEHREDEASVRVLTGGLAQEGHGFGGVAMLHRQGAAKHVARGWIQGIESQRTARGGFCLREAVEKKEGDTEVVEGLFELRIQVDGFPKFGGGPFIFLKGN